MSEKKITPKQQQLINKNAGERKAFLKKISYGTDSYSQSGQLGFNQAASDNKEEDRKFTLPQDTASFDLWVLEVNYGYGLVGQNAVSRFYNKFYPQYFKRNPFQIKGLCKDEAEYNALAKFIREQQVNATIDHNNLFLLEIPGAGVRSLGVVMSFQAGVSVQNQGIPVAPEFVFEFVIFRDLTDPHDINFNRNAKFSEFIKYPTNKTATIKDGQKIPAIFSTDAGAIKPFNPARQPFTSNNDPISGINDGTKGAKGS